MHNIFSIIELFMELQIISKGGSGLMSCAFYFMCESQLTVVSLCQLSNVLNWQYRLGLTQYLESGNADN